MEEGESKYLQFYIYDDQNELSERERELSTRMLIEKSLKNLLVFFLRTHIVTLNPSVELDQRVYNKTTTIRRPHLRSDQTKTIQTHYGCYDTLSYPLSFPNGESGWHPKISGQGVSIDEIITENENADDDFEDSNSTRGRNTVTMHRILFQQFVVDRYMKIETSCLKTKPKLELIYSKVLLIVLMSVRVKQVWLDNELSYLQASSEAHMTCEIQEDGKPDIFLTMTCNPNWKEILDELLPKTNSSRSTRSYYKKDLKVQLLKRNITGEVYVVDFQKRGLRHAHFLVITRHAHKMTNPDNYNKIVYAEIPDPIKYLPMHDLVKNHMIHYPCGSLREKSPCMEGVPKKCRFRYARKFNDKTSQGEDSYPLYRRKNNGIKMNISNTKLGSSIQPEVGLFDIKSVKYIFKYLYKGHDKQVIHIDQDIENDMITEIRKFQDARYVCPPEMMWRIFSFPLFQIHPCLVRFKYGDRLEDIVEREKDKNSMLTTFFEKNKEDSNARKYIYKDFPNHFTWNTSTHCCSPQKIKSMIGRLVYANPRYYQRLLLCHINGPTYFEDIYTTNGVLHPTFQNVALERGLIETDDNLSQCLAEASLFQFPNALRRLFATILIFCEPGDVRKLWCDHYDPFYENYRR
uniref:Helitron helicase-like domain-containing protein n=1 Tax=Lactuca sativa TaxID=4236 RepID=A0A9R1V8T2_LACSA|nr:hypothetical protein LSAT_V11C600309890 [Lactuca sativa]